MDKPEVRTGSAPVERITNHQFEEMLERARSAEKRALHLSEALGVLRGHLLTILNAFGYVSVSIHETDGELTLSDVNGKTLSLRETVVELTRFLREVPVTSPMKGHEQKEPEQEDDGLKELWNTMPQETKDQIRKLLEAEKSDGSGQ